MVNGITSNQAAQIYGTSDAAAKSEGKAADKTAKASYTQESVVYEKSSYYKSISSMSKSDRSAIVAKLKADADSRAAQLRELVEKMFTKQANIDLTSKSSWDYMIKAGVFDAGTIAQAKADVAEDGYWGADQTSDRILSFASALAGDDEEKMQEMLEAFKKGFSQAAKSWGAALPDLCQNTYSAVMDKFDSWFAEHGTTQE